MGHIVNVNFVQKKVLPEKEENKTLIIDNQFQIIQLCELSNSWDKQLKTKITLKGNRKVYSIFLFLELEASNFGYLLIF